MQGLSPSSDASKYGLPLDDAPSTRQGFGRAALSLSLPLAGSSPSFNLQVVGKRDPT